MQPLNVPDIRTIQRRQQFDDTARASVQPGLQEFDLFVLLDGPGELLHPTDDVVPFPVRFIEEPVINYSFSLDPSGVLALTAGNFPTLSVGARQYTTVQPQPGVDHYTGVQVIIVAGGHTGMRMKVHVTFTGVALINPATPTDGGLRL